MAFPAVISWLEENMLRCWVKAITGFDCPGCGMQRAVIALLKGEFVESLHLYPALFPTIFMLLFLTAHLLLKFRHGAEILKWTFIINAIIMVGAWLAKLSVPCCAHMH